VGRGAIGPYGAPLGNWNDNAIRKAMVTATLRDGGSGQRGENAVHGTYLPHQSVQLFVVRGWSHSIEYLSASRAGERVQAPPSPCRRVACLPYR
jgi:hypothetical protein